MRPRSPPTPATNPRLDPDWEGNGQPVTFAFGGDVHFPAGTTLGDRLAADPADALGPTVPALLSGADLSMVNLESALTDGTCPQPQSKQYVFYAPATAITAFKDAGVTLITEANNHGEDCGAARPADGDHARAQSGYPILGIGQNVTQAFTPYTATIHGEHIVIIAATQVIDSDLQTAWTATATQPGLASAYDINDLVAAVEAARKTADTVDRLPALGDRTRAARTRCRSRWPRFWSKRVPTSSSAPTRTSCSVADTWVGLRRLRARQLRLLRQLAARERQRIAGDLGHRAATSTRSPGGRPSSSTTCPSRSRATPPRPRWRRGTRPGPAPTSP